VAELVDRADRAQDIAVTGIFQEAHEAYGSSLASGKLSERKACRPGHRVHEAGRGPESDPYGKASCEPGGETDCRAVRETDQEPNGNASG
jgi:hypothetical protein